MKGSLKIALSSALLSAASISELGLISSMVGFLHDQKDNVHTYQINWEPPVQLVVEPKHLWTDQGHTSNGVAGYGFFLGLFGLFVAWKVRRGERKTRSKSLVALLIFQFLVILFTLSAIIFVFLVTNQTKGQSIFGNIAQSGITYPADKWTPETWFNAVVNLPMADQHQQDNIKSKITNMTAWRWLLIPILFCDISAFSFSMEEYVKQRNGANKTEFILEK